MWIVALASMAGANEPYGSKEEAVEHMKGHFDAGTETAWAICRGDLETAKEIAEGLDHKRSDVPVTWYGYLGAMRKAARRVWMSSSTSEAASRMGRVASACASCHQSVSGGPDLSPEEQRVDAKTAAGDHELAWYYLWMGLALNDDALWRNAATAMAAAPEHAKTESQASSWVSLGKQARSAANVSDRSYVFQNVVGSCVPCHAAAGVELSEAFAPPSTAESEDPQKADQPL